MNEPDRPGHPIEKPGDSPSSDRDDVNGTKKA
jgi:hypothetical protein